MGVKLQSSSGGSVEIAAPVTASNYVLTAPATTGIILNDQSSLAAANLTGDIASARITSALNASGSAPIYACRAWVNFNGTGTVAIRASGNVSSITDLGTGIYRINFTTSMPDANYSVVTGDEYYGVGWDYAYTTSSFETRRANNSFSLADIGFVSASVFR